MTPQPSYMNDFYTYAYLREDLSPYYVGKGKGNRILSDLRSIHKPTDISRIVFLRENMTEKESFDNEVEMIKLWGRKDLNTGMLRNKTDGGEGSSGHKFSDETKEKLSFLATGRKHTEESKAKIRLSKKYISYETRAKMRSVRLGMKLSEETKAKIGLAHKGRIFSYESKAKMRLARLGKKMSEASKKRLSLAQIARLLLKSSEVKEK